MKLIAHRGIWNDLVKKNSYEAIKNGLLSDKYIGIECDVRCTLDNKFIIYHNALYKGNLVKNIKYDSIKNDVCTLEDILKINTNKIILLELKDFDMNLDNFLKVINKYKRNIYIMSFSTKIIEDLRRITNKHKVGVLNYVLNSDSNYNFDFICLLDIIASNVVCEKFKKRNIDVIIYGTINPSRNLTYIIDDNDIK